MRACANLAIVDISASKWQGTLPESVYVTSAVPDQLRYMSPFDVVVNVPRDATLASSDMAALPLMDRFSLPLDFLLTMLRLGIHDDVSEDAEPLARNSHLGASFSEIPTVWCVAACSCSLVPSTVTSVCERAAYLHFWVKNVQDPCLPEPALSWRCFLFPPGK